MFYSRGPRSLNGIRTCDLCCKKMDVDRIMKKGEMCVCVCRERERKSEIERHTEIEREKKRDREKQG
jgi:hypothetical protein